MSSSRPSSVPDLLALPAPTGWRALVLRLGARRAMVAVTALSVVMSLVTTLIAIAARGGSDNLLGDLAIAAIVPLLVAPAVSHLCLSLLYEAEDARSRTREAAIRDGLTNLYNRRFFIARLQAEVQRAHGDGTALSLIMIDVDHFKLINDRRGHATGDEVLEAIGSTLIATVGPYDVTARFGGEEFVVLLPKVPLAVAEATAERVRLAIGRLQVRSFGDDPLPHVTASLGVSSLGERDDTSVELLARADKAMYRAKETGRDRCIVFSEDARLEAIA